MAVINVLILKKNPPNIHNWSSNQFSPRCAKPQFLALRTLGKKGIKFQDALLKYFFHIFFLYITNYYRTETKSDIQTCQTMWHSSGVSTGLARQQTSKNTYYLKQNTHKHTIHVPFPLCCHTTKLALWGEYEPDCVPELPQFVLVSFLWNFKHTGEDLPN